MHGVRTNASHWLLMLVVSTAEGCSSEGGSTPEAGQPASNGTTEPAPQSTLPSAEVPPASAEATPSPDEPAPGGGEVAPPISGISEGMSEAPGGAAPMAGAGETPSDTGEPVPGGQEEPPVDDRPPAAPEGVIRPNPGATKIDVTNPEQLRVTGSILGRRNLVENDDQFTVAIGNLLVMSDDQLSPQTNRYAGTVIGIHDTAPDTTAPRVDFMSPKDGAVSQATTSRVGLSFTDNVELATVDSRSFIVRPVGGRALEGTYSVSMSILSFQPAEPLQAGTTYEVVLPAGGVKDYVGNGVAEEFRSTFTTR